MVELSKNMKMIRLDVCTSAYNEAGNIDSFVERVTATLDLQANVEWKIIIVDNGSNDSTWTAIENHANEDNRILAIRLTRNFGFERAILAALSHSEADCNIVMACDLEDEPERIPLFLSAFQSGFDNVFQVVEQRSNIGVARKFLTKAFYKIGAFLTNRQIYPNASDFRLVSARLRTQLVQSRDLSRFNRAIVNYFGFPAMALSFPRAQRTSGKSKSTSRYVISLAIGALFSNSKKPLYFVGIFAIIVSVLSFATLFILSFSWIFYGVPFGGFGTIVGFLLLLFSFNFLALGVMSQYLAIALDFHQNRPLFVIESTVNK